MILGKMMMIQAANQIGNIDYQISKTALKLGVVIENYTLERFIHEAGVSKTSLMRYLQKLGVKTFTEFKKIVSLESAKGLASLKADKEKRRETKFDDDVVLFGKIILAAKHILILGDGNCFGLMLYLKAFIHLGIDIEIPIYLGKEENVFSEYNMDEDDLIIFISLHETYESFLNNRSYFYQSAKYYQLKSLSKVAFVGEVDETAMPSVDYQFAIDTSGPLYYRKAKLDRLFELTIQYLCTLHKFD
ncbi:hypothetical protein [Thomasclavelia sp.]|uniref:hypothetical protein n=1 Tax=Thomasclavelia sp. TaxID=3025757 RepID=UPI0025E161B2|nr:hypothetical protein [Thomasclavelia sp.]